MSLTAYQQALNNKGGKELLEFEKELVTLMKWKLRRGQYRPQLLSFVQSNQEKLVQDVTSQAFSIYAKQKNIRNALTKLCLLKGVGPATASKILQLVDVAVPFMSDEALTAVGCKLEYTHKNYEEFLKRMQ